MMDSCLLPLTLQGQEGTKLSTFLLSCLPQEPDQLEGEDKKDLLRITASAQHKWHSSPLTSSWDAEAGTNNSPTLLLQKPKSSWKHLVLASLESHTPTPICPSAAAHSYRNWRSRWGLCLGWLPFQSLPWIQHGSRRALVNLSSSHAGSNSAGRT